MDPNNLLRADQFPTDSKELDALTRKSISAFRGLKPTLDAYARVLTGKNLRVVMHSTLNGATDGDKIYMRPPLALGIEADHERRLCDRRDEETGRQKCFACRRREEVLVVVYHEIAHVTHGTMNKVSDYDQAEFLRQVMTSHGGKFGDEIKGRIVGAPYALRTSFMGMSNLVSPYFGMLVNAIEDARVNMKMYQARPGTKAMMDAVSYRAFVYGVEQRDPVTGLVTIKQWRDYALDAQMMVAVYCAAINLLGDWFNPKVMESLKDPDLARMIEDVQTLRSMKGSVTLAFKMLVRLRELGFLLLPEEREEEPPPPPQSGDDEKPESSDSDDDTSDESSPEESAGDPGDSADSEGEGESELDQETESPDDQGDDTGGVSEPDESDSAGDPGTEGSASDEPGDDDSGDGEDSTPDSDISDDSSDGTGQPDSGSGDAGDSQPDSSNDPDSDPRDDADPGISGDDAGSSDGDEGSSDGGSDRLDADESDDPTDGSDVLPVGTGGTAGQDAEAPDTIEHDADEDVTAEDGELTDDESDTRESDPDGDGGDLGGVGSDVPATEPSEPADLGDHAEDDAADDDGSEPSDAGDEAGGDPSDEGEPEFFGGDPDEDNSIEVGPSEGDAPGYGTPEDAEEALKAVSGHEEPETPLTVKQKEALRGVIERALNQSQYFDSPSIEIEGLKMGSYINGDWCNGKGSVMHHNGVKSQAKHYMPEESILGPALLKMRRAFADNARGGDQRNLRSGKVNARALGRRAWQEGEDRLFLKRKKIEKKKYFVLIGIDFSGSTEWRTRMATIKRCAMAQAELCHRLGIDFAIYAHSGDGSWYSVDSVLILPIKEAHEPWTDETKEKLARLRPYSANLDGHTLEFYRKRLDEIQGMTDGIIMYYTDGDMPLENFEEELEILQREIDTCRKNRYTLMAVGIETDSPRQHGLDTCDVWSDEDVSKVVAHLERRLASG